MNFAEIEKEINTLAKKASDGTISIDEMAGGSFTISNGGVYGSLLSTPIINPPQVWLYYILENMYIMHAFHWYLYTFHYINTILPINHHPLGGR